MALSYAETKKIERIGEKIISLANDYDVEITKMFKRFSDVPHITKEWVGQSAEFYYDQILFDKGDFLEVSESIKQYGKKLISDATSIDETIDKAIKVES